MKRLERLPDITCPCGASFAPYAERQRFCSKLCANNRNGRYRRNETLPICEQCRRPMASNRKTRRFCSIHCQGDWYSANITGARASNYRHGMTAGGTSREYWRLHNVLRRREAKIDTAKILLARQKGRCVYCRRELGESYQVDHRMPLALGGSNNLDNLQALCKRCNLKKHAKHPDQFAREMIGEAICAAVERREADA